MFQYHPLNPFRPVNWRWEMARVIREEKSPSNRYKDDKTLYDACQFQTKLTNCKDDLERWDLMDEYPDFYSAYLIYRRGEEEDRHPLRFAIEARLLARQKDEEIAETVGLPVKTITIYEAVFFNVKDKLENSDYIMTCVIGPSVQSGLTDRDYDLLWKLFGYLYGKIILDTFIRTTSRKFNPETIEQVDAALAEDTRSTLQRKAAIVTRAFSVNPFSQSELLNIYARFLEIEKESDSGKAHDVIMQNIQVMLDKLPWASGEDAEITNAEIAKYDKNAVELRTDELLTVSSGKALPNYSIEEPKFPEVAIDVPKNTK